MLCGMLEKGRIEIQGLQKMYDECIRFQKRICREHFSEAASYISEAVTATYDGCLWLQRSFTVRVCMKKLPADRFENYRCAIGADDVVLTAYKLAAFHRLFRDDALSVPVGSRRRLDQFLARYPDQSAIEDMEEKDVPVLCTESTSTGHEDNQVLNQVRFYLNSAYIVVVQVSY
ncbi:hypothetical protein COOONC_06062 [Cooperia oncophora]